MFRNIIKEAWAIHQGWIFLVLVMSIVFGCFIIFLPKPPEPMPLLPRLCGTERTQAEAAAEQWWAPGLEHRTTVLLNCLDAHD